MGSQFGHDEGVDTRRFINGFMVLVLLAAGLACGRKSDPIPRLRAAPKACEAHWSALRQVEIRLPLQDVRGDKLRGVEHVHVYYLPLGTIRPTSQDVVTRGELVMERRRPDLPSPGETLRMDLHQVSRAPGWIVVCAVRVGGIVGTPSDVLPWLDSTF